MPAQQLVQSARTTVARMLLQRAKKRGPQNFFGASVRKDTRNLRRRPAGQSRPKTDPAGCPIHTPMILTKCAVCATELGLTLGKKCGRCSTRYCGAECQVQHWKEGGHDQLCKK